LPARSEIEEPAVSAAAQRVPQSLLNQLADPERMILPVRGGKHQYLELWRREGNSFSNETLFPVAFVPLSASQFTNPNAR
jgi:protein-L-isoaspartate(D-aspartate) O-methyltransferase